MAQISAGWARQVGCLGITQILGYGTIFYAYPILAGSVAQEFDVPETHAFAVFSIGLLLGGLFASVAGAWLDRFGAPRVMALGSLLVAILSAALGFAPNFLVFGALIITLQALSFIVLYDAAFAALALGVPQGTRKAITRLTLIAGFASTLFWPLTGYLIEILDWRATYMIFAALHLLIALPLHLWLARTNVRQRRATAGETPSPAPPDWPVLHGQTARRAFWALGASFALTGMAIAALGVHLVPSLIALGLGGSAYLVGMLMGPAQVAVRLLDATIWRNLHPMNVALISGTAIVLALVALLAAPLGLGFAIAFAILFGAGQGLASIVRGAVPLALFGAAGIGRRLGHLAALRNVTGAAAPVAFALSASGLGLAATVGLTGLIAALGLVLLVALHLGIRHHILQPSSPPVRNRP
ncbi:MAG: MFS transporter [Rhodobacteraceae bacterium]|nr:MAG: MFS transporter [Paracoccaceae bacterium]